jgi:hypothetical protein
MSTPAQIAANQANAQLSSGPKSAEGKAKSSLNAISTGLTGRTVLLPSDDAKAYSDHMANYFVRFEPATPEEEEIVQDIAQTKWRLNRIPHLEEDLWALGSVMFANMFEEQPGEVRPGLIRAHTLVTYGKRFDNLYLQESRLTRRYDKLVQHFRDLKAQRQAQEAERKTAASHSTTEGNGFEFSDRPSSGRKEPRTTAELAELVRKFRESHPMQIPSASK